MRLLLKNTYSISITLFFVIPTFVFGFSGKIADDFTSNHQLAKSGNETSVGFLENKGQITGFDGSSQPEVKYVFEKDNAQIFLLNSGIAYQFSQTHYPDNYFHAINSREYEEQLELLELQKQVFTETFRMDMKLVGANTSPEISTGGRSEEYFNFYTHDALEVHHFETITYHDVYPGIDWVIYISEDQIKYDFVLNAGANPSVIQIEYTDHEELRVDQNGRLILANRMGEIIENKPVSFQQGKELPTDFVLNGDVMTFHVADYDPDQPLIIDPEIYWSTYYGGSNLDHAASCKADAEGNIFMNGYSESTTAIADGGHQNNLASPPDAYLVKFNSAGVRQWATYYGGTELDRSYYSDLDSEGNIYIAGQTVSTTGIASNGHQNTYGGGSFDGFLVKFNTSGERQWGTYYGGAVYETGYDCATDSDDNIYLAGATNSPTGIAEGGHNNAPASTPFNEAYLVKFNAEGQRIWGTYFGGTSFDNGWGCTVDPQDNVYLAGSANSIDGIAFNAHQEENGGGMWDAFLAKFNSGGTLLWSTFYGGSATESGFACATDLAGNVYLTGHSGSPDNISHLGHQMDNTGTTDGYLAKFDGDGVRQWGTYYGGSGFEEGLNCLTDPAGNVYIAGVTTSTDAMASNGFQNDYGGGDGDGFVVQFSSSGDRIWGSYCGSNDYDALLSLAMGQDDELLLAGLTESNNGISTPGAHQSVYGGNADAFLMGVSSTVSIPEQESNAMFTLYPNPSADNLILQSKENRGELRIYSADGRVVQRFSLNAFESVIDISSLSPGVYIMALEGDEDVYSTKFIKR